MQIREIERVFTVGDVTARFLIVAVRVATENLCGGCCQRAVDIDGRAQEFLASAPEFFFLTKQLIDDFLGAPDSKGRDDDIAATIDRFCDDVDESLDFIGSLAVFAVSIGRLDHQVVRPVQ